jgi:hypothetical protein
MPIQISTPFGRTATAGNHPNRICISATGTAVCIYCPDKCPNSSRNRRSLIQTLPQTRSRRIAERNHEYARGSDALTKRVLIAIYSAKVRVARRTENESTPETQSEWHLAVLRKPQSLRCQCVEIKCLDFRPVATEIGKGRIISHDQDNIRSFAGINRCKTSQCRNENTYPVPNKFCWKPHGRTTRSTTLVKR